MFVGIDGNGVTVGVGVSTGATDIGVSAGGTGVGVVPTSLLQAMLNSKRGAARAKDSLLIAEKNMDSIISVQYVGKSGLDVPLHIRMQPWLGGVSLKRVVSGVDLFHAPLRHFTELGSHVSHLVRVVLSH